jgi:hypothetical protein
VTRDVTHDSYIECMGERNEALAAKAPGGTVGPQIH